MHAIKINSFSHDNTLVVFKVVSIIENVISLKYLHTNSIGIKCKIFIILYKYRSLSAFNLVNKQSSQTL